MTFAEAKKVLREKFPTASLGLHAEMWCTVITDEVPTYTVTVHILGDRDYHNQGSTLEEAVWKAVRAVKRQHPDDALRDAGQNIAIGRLAQ